MDIELQIEQLTKPHTLPSGRVVEVYIDRVMDRLLKRTSNHVRSNNMDDESPLYDLVEYTENDPRTTYRFLPSDRDKLHSELGLNDFISLDHFLSSMDITNLITDYINSNIGNQYSNGQLLLQNPLKTYSTLKKTLIDKKLGAARPKQWIKLISNLQGITEDEKCWSDVMLWLERQESPRKISSEELIQHIQFEFVQPKLFRLASNDPSKAIMDRVDQAVPLPILGKLGLKSATASTAFKHPSFGYRVLDIKFHDLFGQQQTWLAVDDQWNVLTDARSRNAKHLKSFMDLIADKTAYRFPKRSVLSDTTRWGTYTLPGLAQRQEWLFVLEDFPASFIDNAHYDARNVLFHLRTSERFDTQGRRFFLIEELQSDWLQKRNLNQHHYIAAKGHTAAIPWANRWYELGINTALFLAAQQGYTDIAIASGQQQQNLYGRYFEDQGIRFYDKTLLKTLDAIAKHWQCEQTEYAFSVGWDDYSIVRSAAGYSVIDRNGEVLASGYVDLKDAESVRSRLGHKKYEINSGIKLSHELIEHLNSKGIPLFGKLSM